MGNRSLTLVCKGGATVQARTATLAGASPVLCEALEKPLAKAGEPKLPEDDAVAWGTVLRLLEAEGNPEAALLSWDNLESVLVLADKYDMAAVRAICAGFMGANHACISLYYDLTSPKNALYAGTLMLRYCNQPQLAPFLAPADTAIAKCLQAPNVLEANKVVSRLRKLLAESNYQEVIGRQMQFCVTQALARDLVPVFCPKCQKAAGLWGSACDSKDKTFKCNCSPYGPYTSADEAQIPLELDQEPNDRQSLWPDSFAAGPPPDEAFALPEGCRSRCSLTSVCTIAAEGEAEEGLAGQGEVV